MSAKLAQRRLTSDNRHFQPSPTPSIQQRQNFCCGHGEAAPSSSRQRKPGNRRGGFHIKRRFPLICQRTRGSTRAAWITPASSLKSLGSRLSNETQSTAFFAAAIILRLAAALRLPRIPRLTFCSCKTWKCKHWLTSHVGIVRLQMISMELLPTLRPR